MRNNFRKLMIAFLFMGLLAVGLIARSQQNPAAPNPATQALIQEANGYFQNQDWAKAAKAYQALTEQLPNNGGPWFRLGHSLHSLAKYPEAIAAYHRAVEIGKNPVAMYNLACSYARNANKDKAFEWLNNAIKAGFNQTQTIKSDEDLASLREDPRFKALLQEAEYKLQPCSQPVYQQFDFWVGEWNVFVNGKQAGANDVKKILSGCVVFENWTDMAGKSGKSFNTFNAQKGKWQQTWVDDSGNVIEFVGEAKDGVMGYKAETLNNGGLKILHRMTFTKLAENRVRQLWEQSSDGGQTWKVAFDGDYQRKQ